MLWPSSPIGGKVSPPGGDNGNCTADTLGLARISASDCPTSRRVASPAAGFQCLAVDTSGGSRKSSITASCPLIRSGGSFGLVGVLHLPTQRAVTVRHVDRDEIGEFGQIRLAENHRAGGTQQLANDGRILPGSRRFEGKGAGGGVLAVGCCDVVLDEDGDTGERAAVRRLLAVAQRSDGERVLIDLAHRVEARPGAVTAFDLRDRHNVFSPALNRLRHIQRLPPSDHSVDASDLEHNKPSF